MVRVRRNEREPILEGFNGPRLVGGVHSDPGLPSPITSMPPNVFLSLAADYEYAVISRLMTASKAL